VACDEKIASLGAGVKAARRARTFRFANSFGLDAVPCSARRGSQASFACGKETLCPLKPSALVGRRPRQRRLSMLDAGLRVRIEVEPLRRTTFSTSEDDSAHELTDELAALVSRLASIAFAVPC
jgi:hypothetical protein